MDIKFKQKNKIENPMKNINSKEMADEQAEYKRLWAVSTEMVCEECNEKHFIMAYKIRKVSALASGFPKDVILKPFIPIPVCSACGHVNSMFEQSSNEIPDING